MFPVVALDIETTGLDHRKDAIIEIGAVKSDGEKVIDTWQSLINPGRRIPDMITQLTGITSQMVVSAPPISAKIQSFADFVGDLPIIGHNIAFDLAFLNMQHDFTKNPIIDTFELASVLLPSAPRYSLVSLVETFGIKVDAHHRALEDAIATLEAHNKMLTIARDLPVHLIAEIVQSAKNIRWDGLLWNRY